MEFYVYNTMTKEKEPFRPRVEGHVGIYVCGPTVYSDAHLGHAKSAVSFDTLRRWLLHLGYKVRYVSNVTDVGHLTDDADAGEDKIQKRAKIERLEPMEIADKYFWRYFEDMAALNVLKPDITPRATGHIVEQIELTKELIRRGFAYERQGSVYFRARKWPDYGKLSGRRLEDQAAGARVEVREEKEDPRDWALWKRAEPDHLMRWPSPWGEGFPGWHIECTVMSLKYLGEGFDIHGGGIDLQFPHHEAEIAQAEAAGHAFARYWMHNNHVLLGGEKMAKSTGNFITLRELFEKADPLVVRFYLLQSHYRSVTDFTEAGLEAAKRGYARLLNAYREVRRRLNSAPEGEHPGLEAALKRLEADFAAAMNDDLATPEALAAFFAFLPELNKALAGEVGRATLARVAATFDRLGEGVLGLFPPRALEEKLEGPLLEGLIELLIELRQAARARRDFEQADAIRERLRELGVVLEDTPRGTRWKLVQ